MQGTRLNGRRIVSEIIPILVLIATIVIDRVTKAYIERIYAEGWRGTTVIEGFFEITRSLNKGAAWSLFADKEWGQTFFKILTLIALPSFMAYYVYAVIKNKKWLKYALSFIIGGMVGNFVDRMAFGAVTDFLSFTFGSYVFPTFNMADTFLCVGVAMLMIYYLFFDDSALLGKNGKKELSDKQ